MKVLITGTSSGIGQATAEKFINEGHEVYGIDILDASITNPSYHHFKVDVRSKQLPLINDLNIIISNAGVQDEETSLDINLLGAINVVEHYLKLTNDIKSILFVASASARSGAEFPLYSVSKGGLVTFMKNLALRVGKLGATCNSISPGAVITNINKHIIENEKLYKEVANESILKKWIQPSEIAEWIYFITVINKSMTGEDVLVDNGEYLNSNFIW